MTSAAQDNAASLRAGMAPQVLPDRGVLEVGGSDAAQLLNALLTNAVPPLPATPGAPLVFAGLLSPQGKVQFEFLVFPREAAYLLDVARDRIPALQKSLTLYRLRAAVTFTDRSAELAAIAGIGQPDPRNPDLPPRALILPAEAASLAPIGPYHAQRIAAGVPEGGHDYGWNEVFPHEALYDRLNGIDFKKGCYVGQEIVSRMQHRGTARSRFVPVAATAPLPPRGTEVRAGPVLIGTLGSGEGLMGLALLRLDRVRDAMAAGTPMTANDVTVHVSPAALAAFGGTP